MEKISKNINGIDVTFIKTKKFKSICACLYFKGLVTEEKLIYYNLMRSVLLKSTKKYNTEEKLNMRILETYNPYYGGNCIRYGNYVVGFYCLDTLGDKYTEPGNLKRVVNIFNEIVFNPNVDNYIFNEEDFNLCKERLITSLKKVKESQKRYAAYRLVDFLNKDKPYSYNENEENVSRLNPSDMYKYYVDMLQNSEVSLVIAGDVDENDKAFDSIIKKIKKVNKFSKPLIISNDDEPEGCKEIIETGDGNENVLHLLCYLKDMSLYELNYVVPLYRYIFGGSGNSRLFNEVREKNSLAYYIYARYDKDDSVIDIVTGIKKENYEKTLSIIKNELQKMNSVTEDELASAKKYLRSSLVVSQDYVENVTSRYYYEKLYKLPPIDEYVEKLNDVTLKEVQDISSKVHPAICYFLKGSDEDE